MLGPRAPPARLWDLGEAAKTLVRDLICPARHAPEADLQATASPGPAFSPRAKLDDLHAAMPTSCTTANTDMTGSK
jgi:hypothetical protein